MGRVIICKDCGEEKPYYAKNLCKRCYRNKQNRKYRKKHKERLMKYRRKNYENTQERTYANNLRYKFGISLADYDEMLESQGNTCWICGKTPEKNGQRLAVDHNHETGEVRGLLCRNCNHMLGFAKDNPLILTKAVEYLMVFDENY